MPSMNRRTFLGRSALIGAASFAPLGFSGCGNSSTPAAGAPGMGLVLTADLAGIGVDRQQVLVWEARRLQVVATRMSGNMAAAEIEDLSALVLRAPEDTSNIVQERNLLADAKIKAGDAAMQQLVAGDLLVSGAAIALACTIPGYAVSQIDIVSNRGTAEGFSGWFVDHALTLDDERSMLVACPDHYLLRALGPKGQNVIEETGGALVASQFAISLDNTAGLPLVLEPDFPVRLSGAAFNAAGTVIGGVNHRFKDLDQGFQSRLAVFFPAALPFWFITEHRWHLACEFSNWITAYIAQTGD